MSTSITPQSQTLATIDTADLRALLYGDAAGREELLRGLAAEAGVDPDLVLMGATGEPGHDPRTGVVNPRAVYDPETAVVEDDLDDLPAEEPDDGALWDPAPRPGEDLEATVTRRQAARDMASAGLAGEHREADLGGDLVEVALYNPRRAAHLAAWLRDRGLLADTAPTPAAYLAEVA